MHVNDVSSSCCLLQDNGAAIALQPEVVIIDTDNENLTLITDFLVDYTPSTVSVLSIDQPIGNVNINVLFQTNQVSQYF